jgi:hypothetical protein
MSNSKLLLDAGISAAFLASLQGSDYIIAPQARTIDN